MGTVEYKLLNKTVLWTTLGLLIGIFYMIVFPVLPKCWWHVQYSGVCPTCYITRAFRLLMSGNISQSVALHPGAIGIVIFLLGQIGFRVAQLFRSKPNQVVDLGVSVTTIILLWFLLHRSIF